MEYDFFKIKISCIILKVDLHNKSSRFKKYHDINYWTISLKKGFLKNEMIGLDLRKEKVSLTLITFKNSFYDRSNGVLINYWKSAGRSKKTEFSFSLGLVDGYKKEQGLYFISDKALLFETTKELLFQERMKNSVRLLGISLNNLNTEVKKTVVVQLKFDF